MAQPKPVCEGCGLRQLHAPLSVRDCFKQFYANYRQYYKEAYGLEDKDRLQKAYDRFWEWRQQDLAHYYRYLYNVLRFVHDSKGIDDKLRYVKLLRAQLSDYEMLMLFYTALNSNGLNYWVYIDEYELFDNLPPTLLIEPHHRNLYSDRSFGGPKEPAIQIWPPSLLAMMRDRDAAKKADAATDDKEMETAPE